MPFFTGGYVQFKREALRNIALDENLKEAEQWLLVQVIALAWPYNFTMTIDDGNGRSISINIKRGEVYATIKELMEAVRVRRQQTLSDRLRKLERLQYIEYEPGLNQYRMIHLKVRDYDYYLESASTEIVEAKTREIASTKTVDPPPFASTEIVEAGRTASTKSVEPPPFASTKTVDPTEDKSSNGKEKEPSNNIIKEYVVNNKQQQEVVVEIQSLFKKKAKTKIPAHVCENLLSRFPLEKIIQNIKRLNFSKADNPPGLLISSLEEDWDIPISEEERMEVEEKIREEEIEKKKREWERTKQEAIPAEQAVEKISVIRSFLKGVGISK